MRCQPVRFLLSRVFLLVRLPLSSRLRAYARMGSLARGSLLSPRPPPLIHNNKAVVVGPLRGRPGSLRVPSLRSAAPPEAGCAAVAPVRQAPFAPSVRSALPRNRRRGPPSQCARRDRVGSGRGPRRGPPAAPGLPPLPGSAALRPLARGRGRPSLRCAPVGPGAPLRSRRPTLVARSRVSGLAPLKVLRLRLRGLMAC